MYIDIATIWKCTSWTVYANAIRYICSHFAGCPYEKTQSRLQVEHFLLMISTKSVLQPMYIDLCSLFEEFFDS